MQHSRRPSILRLEFGLMIVVFRAFPYKTEATGSSLHSLFHIGGYFGIRPGYTFAGRAAKDFLGFRSSLISRGQVFVEKLVEPVHDCSSDVHYMVGRCSVKAACPPYKCI